MMKHRFSASHHEKLFIVTVVIILFGCTVGQDQSMPKPVPEIFPGFLKGYLTMPDLPNSKALLPAPPAEGSAAMGLDESVNRKCLKLQGTPRWELAAQDANLLFPAAAGTFSCAVNAPITRQDTPYLYMLLHRTMTDAGIATLPAKLLYKRPRPFMLNHKPTCTPDEENRLRHDGSYPSGHTAIGWVWALILAEIAPDRANAILARGRAFGESRNVCNVHWHSDVVEGRFIGAATAAKLHSEPAFLDDLAAAKAELDAVRAKGLKPKRDCEAEAEALKE